MAALYSSLLPVTILLLPITENDFHRLSGGAYLSSTSRRSSQGWTEFPEGLSHEHYILAVVEKIETRGREESLTP
jgi:hypothetical protein